MDLVGRDDHPPAGHLVADQLRIELLAAGDRLHFGVTTPARACSIWVILFGLRLSVFSSQYLVVGFFDYTCVSLILYTKKNIVPRRSLGTRGCVNGTGYKIHFAFYTKTCDLSRQLPFNQFIGQILGIIDFSQGFENRAAVDGQCPALLVAEYIVPDQRWQIAVEDDAHQFAVAVDHRAARVAADDVGGADEVQRRVEIQLRFCSSQLFGRAKGGWLPCSSARRYAPAMVVQGGIVLPASLVTFDQSKGQAQREGGVGIGLGAEQREAGVGQLAVGLALRLLDLLFVDFRALPGPADRPAGPAGSSDRRMLRWP